MNRLDYVVHFLAKSPLQFASWYRAGTKNRTSRKALIAHLALVDPFGDWLHFVLAPLQNILLLLLFLPYGWNFKSSVLLLQGLDLLPRLCCSKSEEMFHHSWVKTAAIGLRRTTVHLLAYILISSSKSASTLESFVNLLLTFFDVSQLLLDFLLGLFTIFHPLDHILLTLLLFCPSSSATFLRSLLRIF